MGPADYADALLQYGQAATANPLMLAKALRQQQAYPRENIQQAMNYPQDWSQFGQNLAQAYPTSSPEAVRQAAYQAAVNAGPLATVYHGSPHRFDAFDSSKIGTGEGAQAYGHGLYFAENPKVAREYAGANAGRAAASEGAIDALPKPIQVEVYKVMQMRDGPIKDAHVADIASRSPDAAALIKSKSANLYKVDLPDEHIGKMLDWDKPLSQQPALQAQLREAAKNTTDRHLKRTLEQASGPKADSFWDNGGNFYRSLTSHFSQDAPINMPAWKADDFYQAAASDALRNTGIPGIRYLDGGSRAGGQGTSNFVVFPGNEGILKILSRE